METLVFNRREKELQKKKREKKGNVNIEKNTDNNYRLFFISRSFGCECNLERKDLCRDTFRCDKT